MAVPAAAVRAVLASGDADAADALFRRVLADRVPAGVVQPRWIASRVLRGVFEGYGAVRDFADWCEVFDAAVEFEFGPPPELVLSCQVVLAGWPVRVSCVADEREAAQYFRLIPGVGPE